MGGGVLVQEVHFATLRGGPARGRGGGGSIWCPPLPPPCDGNGRSPFQVSVGVVRLRRWWLVAHKRTTLSLILLCCRLKFQADCLRRVTAEPCREWGFGGMSGPVYVR